MTSTVLPIDFTLPENIRAQIAQFATRDYIARCINAIKKKSPAVVDLSTCGLVGASDGYLAHTKLLFDVRGLFQNEDIVDPLDLPNLQDTSKSISLFQNATNIG